MSMMRVDKWTWLGVVLAALLIGGMSWHNEQAADARRAVQAESDAAAGKEVGWEDFYTSGSVAVTLGDDGTLRTEDGTEVGRVATKTLVTDAAGHVSGNIAMMALDTNNVISLPVKRVQVVAGGIVCTIEDITTTGWNGPDPQPAPGPDDDYIVAVWMESESKADAGAPHEFVYFDSANPGPWSVERSFDISTSGQQLTRTETTTPGTGRASSPVYASEVTEADAWAAKTPRTWSATFGSLSWSGTAVWDSVLGMWAPPITPITAVSFGVSMHKGDADTQYAEFSLAWAGVDTDLSRYHKDLGTWRFEGVGSGVEVWLDAWTSDAHGFTISRPLALTFSDFYLPNRDGTSADLLCVIGPWQASNHYAASLGWATTPDGQTHGAVAPGDTVYPTVAEVRAIGEFVNLAQVTGLDYRVAADSHKLITSAAMKFSKTKESVILYGTEYGGDPDDLEIIQRVPGVNADTCDSSAQVDYQMLQLAHAGALGVFGLPADKAVALDDLVGTGGVASPVATGVFAVTGAGTLVTTLPSNRESRLNAIPSQNFPTGMPGAPNAYHFKATSIFRAYDGQPDQSGGTWSEPAEARYCAQGQPCLRLEFDGPAAATLTVTIAGYAVLVTKDNHLTDQTRQTTFTWTRVDFSYEYEVAFDPAETYAYAYLALPDGAFDPDLDTVETITVSGFGNGAWTVAEPYWSPDPDSTVAPVLKAFESSVDGYRQGGFSAAHDSVARTALCGADEANHGSPNLVETRTVRMFDRVEGVEPLSLDLTSAYSLAQAAARINQMTDAWVATVSTTEYEKAVKDADGNVLSSMYSFDICHPEDAATPLLQAIDNACNASIRCGQWTIVTGILCAIRPDTVMGGMMHGLMQSGGVLQRDLQGESVWGREQGSGDAWAAVGTPTSNNAGSWRSANGNVYATHDPASVLREYGVGPSAESVTSTGRWATREYDIAQLLVSAAGPTWTLYVPEARILLYFYEKSSAIYHIFSNSERSYWEGGTGNTPYTNPHRDVTGSSPSAYRDLRHGQIALAYVSGDVVKLALSNDWGENWEGAVSIDLGVTVERSSVWSDEDSGLAHVVAVDASGNILHAMSSDNFATILGDVNTVTTGQSDAWPTGYTQRGAGGHGIIYVGFADSSGDTVQYSSNDLGKTWNEVA